MSKELLKHLTIDDLKNHPDLLLIAEEIGIESFRKLVFVFGGMSFYLPRVTSIKPLLERLIVNNFSRGKSVNMIARQLNVSESTVRRVLKRRKLC